MYKLQELAIANIAEQPITAVLENKLRQAPQKIIDIIHIRRRELEKTENLKQQFGRYSSPQLIKLAKSGQLARTSVIGQHIYKKEFNIAYCMDHQRTKESSAQHKQPIRNINKHQNEPYRLRRISKPKITLSVHSTKNINKRLLPPKKTPLPTQTRVQWSSRSIAPAPGIPAAVSRWPPRSHGSSGPGSRYPWPAIPMH